MTSTTTIDRPASLDNMAGSTVIKSLEEAYAALREDHPDLPEVLFITGTGLTGRGAKWGHYGADRWVVRQDGSVVDEEGRLPEIFIAGERLECGATETFATMVHEAVHALAVVRGVKDTSRDFRYHNRRFVALAEELGMEWPEGQEPHGTIGFSAVVLTEETIEKYSDEIDALGNALTYHLDTFKRLGLVTGKGDGKEGTDQDPEAPNLPKKAKAKNRSNVKAVCGCEEPRIIRASVKVLLEGEIGCFKCGEEFRAENPLDLV